MHTAGIIAEYNPFHCGHQYHIEETRRQTGADFIIAAVSGDFVQRGAPSLLDKYERTVMALRGGADLVLELPVTTALSSAEGFAAGGVCLLEKLGVTDTLSFGCEDTCNDALFLWTARLLAGEPAEYRQALSTFLKQGMSFPKAREAAVLSVLDSSPDAGAEQIVPLLSRPNNILGLEYQKSLLKFHCRMTSCRIPRKGADYNSTDLSESLSSATAIRKYLLKSGDPSEVPDSALAGQIPPDIIPQLLQAGRENRFLRENDFSDLLFYAFREKKDIAASFGTGNKDLASRTVRLLEQFDNWEQFILLVKSKNQTYTAVSRYFTQVMLDIRREDLLLASGYQYAPYARVLGFRKNAAPLIKEISSRSRIPVLMHLARDCSSLDEGRRRLLDLDLAASDIYNRMVFSRSGCRIPSDYRHPLVLLQ